MTDEEIKEIYYYLIINKIDIDEVCNFIKEYKKDTKNA